MKCPHFKFNVPNDAVRCGHCTSELTNLSKLERNPPGFFSIAFSIFCGYTVATAKQSFFAGVVGFFVVFLIILFVKAMDKD